MPVEAMIIMCIPIATDEKESERSEAAIDLGSASSRRVVAG